MSNDGERVSSLQAPIQPNEIVILQLWSIGETSTITRAIITKPGNTQRIENKVVIPLSICLW